jgi:hypothetical protein
MRRTSQGAPTGGLAREAEGPKRATQRRERFAASGVTQSIDVSALKAELGIEAAKREPEPRPAAEPVPTDAGQRDIALKAFIRRLIPSQLHQRCLDVTLRRHLTVVTPGKLAQAAGCRDREARGVLETWRSGGLVRQADQDVMQYQFAPSKADLALIREFLIMWNDPEEHKTALGWIIEAEAH